MPPRIPRLTQSKIHCSHCREEGHNISKCDIYNIKLHVSLLTNDDSILIPGRGSYCAKLLNPRLLADFKLLYHGKISNITYNNNSITYDNKYEEFTIEDQVSPDINNNKNTISGNSASGEYYSDISTRIKHAYSLQNIKFSDLYDIVNNDYRAVVTRIKEFRAAERARWARIAEEARIRRAEQVAEQAAAQDHIINRTVLPVLTDNAYEANDCPICLDPLGDTNKTILRCGHPMCTPCLLTMTLRSAATRNNQVCICSVCRAPFL